MSNCCLFYLSVPFKYAKFPLRAFLPGQQSLK